MATTQETSTVELTDQQHQQWRDEGFVVVRDLIPPALMQAVNDELLRIMHGDYEDWNIGHFQFYDPAVLKAPNGKMIPGGVQGPATRGEPFAPVADHINIRSVMADLLGGVVRRFTDQCLIKTGWNETPQGGRTYYHQDSYYWHLRPEAGANVWIPCGNVGKDAIALAFMPGSHRDWTLVDHEQYYDAPSYLSPRTLEPFKRHRVPLDQVDYTKETLVPLNTGDGVFFTNYTWHRSEPNRTGKHLNGYAIAYQLDRDDCKTP